ncbi:hypothetical protein [Flavonifractor hominis]|uniref:Uncharacterized protein n=1 Tax=Flavonifractor hominis TaxID=3133178 RepID=A0ABV1EMD9_9FIRM
MAQNTPPPSTDSFRWHQSGSRKIFPIDYSYSEFSKMLGLDYRTIKKYLLHNQMFKKALSELFLDDRDNALPIPLEAVPLLSCFYRLIFSPEFRDDFRLNRPVHSENTMDRFLHALCRELCERVAPPHDPSEEDENDFCRHKLFQDSTFGRLALENLWEDQVVPRYQRLQQLVKYESPENQVALISDLLFLLDDKINLLSSKKPSEREYPSSASSEQALVHMLQCLLAHRKPQRDGNSSVPYYCVDNNFSDSQFKMERAFHDLTSSKTYSHALLMQARRSYLSNLSSKSVVSGFEKEYLKLQSYLNPTFFPDTVELEGYILERCKQYWSPAIDFCNCFYSYNPNPKPGVSYHNYRSYLIDNLIARHLAPVEQAIAFLFQRAFQESATYLALDKYNLHERIKLRRTSDDIFVTAETKEEIVERYTCVQKEIKALSALCSQAWSCIVGEPALPFEEDSFWPTIPLECLYQKFNTAANFFNKRPPFPSLEIIKAAFNYYTQVIEDPTFQYSLQKVAQFFSLFLCSFVMWLLQIVVERELPSIITDISNISASPQKDP